MFSLRSSAQSPLRRSFLAARLLLADDSISRLFASHIVVLFLVIAAGCLQSMLRGLRLDSPARLLQPATAPSPSVPDPRPLPLHHRQRSQPASAMFARSSRLGTLTERQAHHCFVHRSALHGRPNDVVLIFAGIHGNEPTTVYAAERLIELLEARRPLSRPDRASSSSPGINPDGYAARTRSNAAGVDLNRNFPAKNWKSDPTRAATGTARRRSPNRKARSCTTSSSMLEADAHPRASLDPPAAPRQQLRRPRRGPGSCSRQQQSLRRSADDGLPHARQLRLLGRHRPAASDDHARIPVNRVGTESLGRNRESLLTFIHGK